MTDAFEHAPDGRPAQIADPDSARLKLRVVFGEAGHLGPGKIDLLQAIHEKGSISAAGRALGMSYRRAWLLVDALNKMFELPAVHSNIGGVQGGGAALTPFGLLLIEAYRRVEKRAQQAIVEELVPVLKVHQSSEKGR